MTASEVALLGGLATSLCLSFAWPFCYQRQYGINGFSHCPHLCKIDCGWIGENDHEFFGTEEDRRHAEELEEEERRRRLAWANRIVAIREQEKLKERMARIHLLPAQNGRARVWAEEIGLVHAHEKKPEPERKEENLDDLIGGSRLRQPARGSIYVHGPAGVDEPGSRRSRSRGTRSARNSGVPPFSGPIVGPIDGSEETPLNRGRMAPQTVLISPTQQQQYIGTAPMTLPPSSSAQLSQGSSSPFLTVPGQDLTQTPSELSDPSGKRD